MHITEVSKHTPSRGGLRSRKITYSGPNSRELARRVSAWIEKGERATDPEWMATCYRMANRYATRLKAMQLGGVS